MKRALDLRRSGLTPGNSRKGNLRATQARSLHYLQQIEDLDAELVVKVAIAGVGHVVDKYESVFLSLRTVEQRRNRSVP